MFDFTYLEIIGLTALAVCVIKGSIYAAARICHVSTKEIRKILMDWLKELLFDSPGQEPPNPVLTDGEYRELAQKIRPHFYNIRFGGCRQENGLLEVMFALAGIRPQYQENTNVLKQSLTYDIIEFILEKRGFEIPVHIKVLTNSELVFQFPISRKGMERFARQKKELDRVVYWKAHGETRIPCTCKNVLTVCRPGKEGISRIIMGVDLQLWHQKGIARMLTVPVSQPHILLTGASGSGKTYLLKFILIQLLYSNVEIWFGDFKNSPGFSCLKGREHFAYGNDVPAMIEDYYALFQQVKEEGWDETAPVRFLMLDEYPGLIAWLQGEDKKKGENIKRIIGELLMLGREAHFGVILTAQRADASIFQQGGVRDNFQTKCALGNMSHEAGKMFFDGPLPDTVYRQGEGLIYQDGTGVTELLVPEFGNMDECLRNAPPFPDSMANGAGGGCCGAEKPLPVSGLSMGG